jgi:hypothetical protein
MTFFAPRIDSRVRVIRSSRHWQSTWIATSVGMRLLLDQAAREVEFDLGGRGEADLDLLEADAHEQLEELDLLLDAHRLGEGLVAVAQVDAAPDRGIG